MKIDEEVKIIEALTLGDENMRKAMGEWWRSNSECKEEETFQEEETEFERGAGIKLSHNTLELLSRIDRQVELIKKGKNFIESNGQNRLDIILEITKEIKQNK